MMAFLRRYKRTSNDESNRDLIVRLIEPLSSPIESLIERLAVSKLRQEGALPLPLLVKGVASELYEEELRNGAWAVDIGFYGSGLFVPEIVREIQERNGTLWKIEKPQSS